MAFAAVEDIETRMMRELTTKEANAAELLLDAVAAELCAAVNRAEERVANVPMLRFISIEAVTRKLQNPGGAEATAETLGAYSYQVTHAESGPRLLTAEEEEKARLAVYGPDSGSARVESIVDDVLDYRDDGELNDSWGS